MIHQDHKRSIAAGFTLVEIVVTTALFILLVGALMGLYSAFTKNHREQFSEQIVQQDIQNMFETMDREVRTGYGSTFGSNNAGTAFWLVNQNGECVEYKLDTSTPARVERVVAPQNVPCDESAFSSTGQPLTSSGTNITKLSFSGVTAPTANAPANGATQGTLSGTQGSVTVSLTACPAGLPPSATSRCVNIEQTEVSRQYVPPPS